MKCWICGAEEAARANTWNASDLFGDFSVADAMYTPVAWRFHVYNVSLPPVAAAYGTRC
jgi:glutathione S-transferase